MHFLTRPIRALLLVSAVGLLLATPLEAATIVQSTPADGVQVPTTSKATRVVLSWTVDRHGCQGDALTARPVIEGPIAVQGHPVTSEVPSGANALTFINSRPLRHYRWYVTMDCPGVGEIRSTTRTFTVQGADPAPRLVGGPRVRWGTALQTWRFQPTCRTGTCATKLRIPGIPSFLMRYNARRGIYTARVSGRKAARAAVCTDPTSGKRHQGAYRGWFSLALRPTATRVSGIHTLVTQSVGRLRGRYTPNARGRALGCAPFQTNDPVRTKAL